jgi:hypothetical protein
MNLIEGQIERYDGAPLFRTGWGCYVRFHPLCLPISTRTTSPLAFSQSTDEGAPAEIFFLEPIGADIVVSCRWGGEEVLVNLRDRPRLKEGQRIRLRPDPMMIHLFEGHSGQRIQVG